MVKAIHVNSTAKTLTEVQYSGYRELRALIGGYFATVPTDEEKVGVVWIDDEGLIKGLRTFFYLKGYPQPIAGNAVITGRCNVEGDETDVRISVEEAEGLIRFLDESEVTAWATLNANNPAVSVVTFEADGSEKTEVLSTNADTFAHMLHKD